MIAIEVFLLASTAGLMTGLAVGLIPTIGPFLAMVLLYPILHVFDPMSIIGFYVCMLMAANFSGSVTGILFGIPGENNSLISSQLGFRYGRRNQATYALALTAIGSFAAAAMTTAALVLWLDAVAHQTWIYSSFTQVLIFAAVYILMAAARHGVLMISIGTALAAIGYSDWFGEATMLGVPMLAPGLSMLPVITALIVIPTLMGAITESNGQIPSAEDRKVPFFSVIVLSWRARMAWLRSVISGMIMGLVPGIGTVIVGNVAYAIEKTVSFSPRRRLLAAESSNNAAAVSSLVPLLCFGIPITASEAVLINLLAEQHAIVNISWFQQPAWLDLQRITWIYSVMMAASLLSAFFCWHMIKSMATWLMRHRTKIYVAVLIVITGMVVYQGVAEARLILDLLTFVFLLPLGFWLRGKSPNTLLLSFLVYDLSSQSAITAMHLL